MEERLNTSNYGNIGLEGMIFHCNSHLLMNIKQCNYKILGGSGMEEKMGFRSPLPPRPAGA